MVFFTSRNALPLTPPLFLQILQKMLKKFVVEVSSSKNRWRKPRGHSITLRFNANELAKVKAILESYNLDFGKGYLIFKFK